jgi:hypothetical protein
MQMICETNKIAKQMDFMMTNNAPFTFSFMIASMRREAREGRSAQSLSYKQLFFCNYVGNLTGIYDVNYFGKITISSIRKDKIGCFGLRSLKK